MDDKVMMAFRWPEKRDECKYNSTDDESQYDERNYPYLHA